MIIRDQVFSFVKKQYKSDPEHLWRRYMATASKEKKQKLRLPKERIVPANPKYYDIEAAFSRSDEIDRKQVAGFRYRARMPQILWVLPAG